jgi:hypothetical protein
MNIKIGFLVIIILCRAFPLLAEMGLYDFQADLRDYIQKSNTQNGFLIQNNTNEDVYVIVKTEKIKDKKIKSTKEEYILIPKNYIHVYENDTRRFVVDVGFRKNSKYYINPKWTIDDNIEFIIDEKLDNLFLYKFYPYSFDSSHKLFSEKEIEDEIDHLKKEGKFKNNVTSFKWKYNDLYKYIYDVFEKYEHLNFLEFQDHLQAIYDENAPEILIDRNPNILNENPKIPLITHHIWLTNPDNPKNMEEDYIKWMENSVKLNPVKDGWQHYLWVQDKKLLPDLVERLSKNNSIVIRELTEDILSKMVNRTEFENALYVKNKVGMASDILRVELLNIFGGFYLDTDYEALQSFKGLAKMYHFIAAQEPMSHFVNNAFLASIPQHPIIKKIIELIKRNYNQETRPDYIKNKDNKNEVMFDENGQLSENIWTTILVTGPFVTTLAIAGAIGQENRIDIILPPDLIYPVKQGLQGPQDFDQILGEYEAAPPTAFGVHYWRKSWVGSELDQEQGTIHDERDDNYY